MNLSLSISGRDRAMSSWISMMRRCYLTSFLEAKHYGARGIKVCERWFDWRNFLADMGERPEGMSLDRINVHGDYSPDNCRWADAKTQARNTTRNVMVEIDGQPMLAVDAAKALGVTPGCITRRRQRNAPLTERTPLKLTAADVEAIRSLLAQGKPCNSIGRQFGVSRQHIAGIRDGRVWSR